MLLLTLETNTFYDKIKQQAKQNRIKQNCGGNFEIKCNNTKTVTNNNRLRISIKRAVAMFLKIK